MTDKQLPCCAVYFMVGGVGIIGSAIQPFLLLCFARESDNQTDEAFAETVNEDASCSNASSGFEYELKVLSRVM